MPLGPVGEHGPEDGAKEAYSGENLHDTVVIDGDVPNSFEVVAGKVVRRVDCHVQ